jgi:ATP-dependent RNA helicase RhlE
VLILTPTRELAMQVEESVRTYGAHLPTSRWRSSAASASTRRSPGTARGVDILVATPGRLLDHAATHVDLSAIEILVLDEADRMLDMGFIRDIRKISRCCPSSARTCSSRPPSRTRSANWPDLPPDRSGHVEVAPPQHHRRNGGAARHRVDREKKRELLII